MIKLSTKERREQFLFLVAVFLLTTAVLCFGIFYDFGPSRQISKQELASRLKQNTEYEELVKEVMPAIDTTYKQIVHFDPKVQAVFLQADITTSIDAIRSHYDRRASDQRYKTFLHAAQFYNRLFFDKVELKQNYNDIDTYNRNLEDCIMTRRQLQQSLISR
ncbi:hypothetical protein C7T94_12930 [Pedobacter yulinensis]|uniref:Type VI secretion system transmembrane protein TssO n=1 Tax=Pedobacter yulinensis TaxID=2126353 RepID=A0A2T3HM62_9SPHI|nr:type VI secretion system transmembrane protein TssO [Pedobacter yulinensis]PST83461.1 hypothetical protein C7T94_12930 [Pedobacter yulinensis]